jgi:hypothetical protein
MKSNPQAASFYVSLVLCGSAFAHNILLAGNTFRDSHSVDKEPLIGFAVCRYPLRTKGVGDPL